jgi:hypothetical protein
MCLHVVSCHNLTKVGMKTFEKRIILNKLSHNGIILDDNLQCTRGNYRLSVKPNGVRDSVLTLWYIVIDNLKDPSDPTTDYFTSYYPTTINAAIRAMFPDHSNE